MSIDYVAFPSSPAYVYDRQVLICWVEKAQELLAERQLKGKHAFTCDMLLHANAGMQQLHFSNAMEAYWLFQCRPKHPIWWNRLELYYPERASALQAFLQHIKELPSVD